MDQLGLFGQPANCHFLMVIQGVIDLWSAVATQKHAPIIPHNLFSFTSKSEKQRRKTPMMCHRRWEPQFEYPSWHPNGYHRHWPRLLARFARHNQSLLPKEGYTGSIYHNLPNCQMWWIKEIGSRMQSLVDKEPSKIQEWIHPASEHCKEPSCHSNHIHAHPVSQG